jgi:hypothetical protein
MHEMFNMHHDVCKCSAMLKIYVLLVLLLKLPVRAHVFSPPRLLFPTGLGQERHFNSSLFGIWQLNRQTHPSNASAMLRKKGEGAGLAPTATVKTTSVCVCATYICVCVCVLTIE